MGNRLVYFPNFDPVIVHIFGPFSLRWYGLMYLLSFLFVLCLGKKRVSVDRNGWSVAAYEDFLYFSFLFLFIGGRVGYVLLYQREQFLASPLFLFHVWEGGMSFHGGLLGVWFATMLWAVWKRQSVLFLTDFVVPLVPIGLGLGRIGNFINGELFGRVTDVPWGMLFPEGGPFPRHPSQLYEGFLEGVVLFFLLNNARVIGCSRLGIKTGVFLVGYAVIRFMAEHFREPDPQIGLIGNVLSMGQLLSIPMALGGGLLLAWANLAGSSAKQTP